MQLVDLAPVRLSLRGFRAGLFFAGHPGTAPRRRQSRCFAFVDGQNLFHAVKQSFGYTYPNYDAARLSECICGSRGWRLEHVFFYTGVPGPADNPFWNGFWNAKLAHMGSKGVRVFSRPLTTMSRRSNVHTATPARG